MPLTDAEFAAILDGPKLINGDIRWETSPDRSGNLIFRKDVETGFELGEHSGLFLTGFHNPRVPTLSFALVLSPEGRIYGLDIASQNHTNPDGSLVGSKHKHRWKEGSNERQAYVPVDITAQASDPVAVWVQFCREARIEHRGVMRQISNPGYFSETQKEESS